MHTIQIILPPDAHILVVKLATIGDLLLATPSLHALRGDTRQEQEFLEHAKHEGWRRHVCLLPVIDKRGVPKRMTLVLGM